LFLGCCAAYVANRFLLKSHLPSPFFQFWFNDLLLAPCAIPVVIWIFRRLRLKEDDAVPSWREVAWILAIWCVLFEWAGPIYLHQGTADAIDVLMYVAGGAIAWWWWKSSSAIQTQ
jgi:hypothetical protein